MRFKKKNVKLVKLNPKPCDLINNRLNTFW